MAKRKNTLVDLLLDLFAGLFPLYCIYLIFLWFTDKSDFWQWIFYGVLYLAIVVGIVFWRKGRRVRMGESWLSDRELIQMLRGKTPTEFEEYIASLFNRLGYNAEAVGRSHDGGIDVIAEKDGVKHYIQCKKFYNREVSVGDVRDFYGAIVDHLTNGKGYFITTNKFTLEAENFAEDKPIELVDSFKLLKYVRLAEEKNKKINQFVQVKQKICPKCGGALIERTGKYGKFLGCFNYPKCQHTEEL